MDAEFCFATLEFRGTGISALYCFWFLPFMNKTGINWVDQLPEFAEDILITTVQLFDTEFGRSLSHIFTPNLVGVEIW